LSFIWEDIVVAPMISLAVAGSVIALLARTRFVTLATDYPNHRSLHSEPRPRLGGAGIAAGIAASWCYVSPPINSSLLATLALLMVISLADDLYDITVFARLLVHFACALIGAAVLLYPEYGIWPTLVLTLAMTWMTNLYNFMDGSDGLAGGMTAAGFGVYGVTALMNADVVFATSSLSISAAAIGFLFFNFPPARIFMGDGASPLGYLAAVFGIIGWQRGDWPVWFTGVVFSAFIVDASWTLFKRLLRGAKPWQAHREHCYQRLVQSGWGHRRTALAAYGLMAVTGGIAVIGIRLDPAAQYIVVITVALFYAALIALLERRLGRGAKQHV
jgi:UDP-N-acetylmuramyl pentapeptide phosphotransferase/UDP-N-acetylglucosamine-1-phosphate transferase